MRVPNFLSTSSTQWNLEWELEEMHVSIRIDDSTMPAIEMLVKKQWVSINFQRRLNNKIYLKTSRKKYCFGENLIYCLSCKFQMRSQFLYSNPLKWEMRGMYDILLWIDDFRILFQKVDLGSVRWVLRTKVWTTCGRVLVPEKNFSWQTSTRAPTGDCHAVIISFHL